LPIFVEIFFKRIITDKYCLFSSDGYALVVVWLLLWQLYLKYKFFSYLLLLMVVNMYKHMC